MSQQPPIDWDLELAAEAAPGAFYFAGPLEMAVESGSTMAELLDLAAPAELRAEPRGLTLRWEPNPGRLVIEAAGSRAEVPPAALEAVARIFKMLALAAPLPRPDDDPTPLAADELAFAAGAAHELANRVAMMEAARHELAKRTTEGRR